MSRNSNLNLEKHAIYEIYRACRLCGAGGGYKMPIIQDIVDFQDESGLDLKQKIQECLQIKVHPKDRMPPLICERCVDKLDGFYDFLALCRQTNRRTRMRLGLPLETPASKRVPSVPAAQSEDDEPLVKSKQGKVTGEKDKKVKVTMDDVALPRESRPPPRGDKPTPSRQDSSKSSRHSRSPSASSSLSGDVARRTTRNSEDTAHKSLRSIRHSRSPSASSSRSGDVAREAPSRRTTRNSEDAAYKSLRDTDSPSPPPNKRATRNSYETDFPFKPTSKFEKSTKLSPKEPVRPTRTNVNIPKKEAKTDEAPQFLKPSPKCHKKPPETNTTKKPELPTPKKKPAEVPTSKTKTEVPTSRTKTEVPTSRTKTEVPTSKTKTEVPTSRAKTEVPTSKTKTEVPTSKTKTVPTSKAKTDAPLVKVIRKEAVLPNLKPRKRPPENEKAETSPPKKIKIPSPPPPPSAPQFSCPVCTVTSTTSQGIGKHLRVHTPAYTPTKLACNACALWFATSEQASSHHKTHRGNNAYSCQRCGNAYKLNSAFNDHLASCLPYIEVPDRKCDSCWRSFPTERLMAQHRCLGEDNRPGGNCSKCSRGYALLKNLMKHESTCQHRKKGELIVDPSILSRIRPLHVRVSRCDALLARRRDGTSDASTVVAKYGLDRSCFYPYGSQIKRAPDGTVSATDEQVHFVHWDSECTDSSDDEISGSAVRRRQPKKLSTSALKVLFSNKCLGKVPRKIREKTVKEDAFDVEVDRDIKNDIRSIIDNIGNDWNDEDDDLFNFRGKEKTSDDLNFDNIFDSLNDHDEVEDGPRSSDSNDVSILKSIIGSKTADEIDTDICSYGLDKELENSTGVVNELENNLDSSIKSKEGLDGAMDQSENQQVSKEILDTMTEKSESLVTANRLGAIDNYLENTAVPDVRLDEDDLESPTLSDGKIHMVEEKLKNPPVADENLVPQVNKDSDEMDQDVDCHAVAVAASLDKIDKHLDCTSVTDRLDESDHESRNVEVTEKNMDDKDPESPKLSSTTLDDTVINEMCLNVLENDLKKSENRLENEQLLKTPDKNFTQFCIDNIINNICKSNDNERNNQNTENTEVAAKSNIEQNLDDKLDVQSEDNDKAGKENNAEASYGNIVYTENNTKQAISEDHDTTKQNGVTKNDNITEKQLLDALDERINENHENCREMEENSAAVDTSDSVYKLGDKHKGDTNVANVQFGGMKPMDLDNVSEDEFDFDS